MSATASTSPSTSPADSAPVTGTATDRPTSTATAPARRGSGSTFKLLQRLGKAFMLPIAILPAAGLLLGIGGALSNPATVAAYPALDNRLLQGVFIVMAQAGAAVFANLAMLLSIGLCIGLAKRDKGTAALAGIVGYLVMVATIKGLIEVFYPGNPDMSIDTGVVGSLVVGGVAVWLHNRYHSIRLPQVLGFFGGSRFVPIVTSFAAILVGAVFFLVWPTFQGWLTQAGNSIASLGVVGTFLYGLVMRLSGAVGLHHIIYPMFWYTELGGTEVVAGESVVGAQRIFFAQLADPGHTGLYTHGTRFFAGRFDTMIFGLPGAALAMFHSVPRARRKAYLGLFLGVSLTSILTGITEPLEYMFLFVAPELYVIHCVYDGLSFLVADLLSVRIGNTFSGGLIDFTLFGILQGNDSTNWVRVIPVGILWFGLYYVTFRLWISFRDVMTPGRGEDSESPGTDIAASLREPALATTSAGAGAPDGAGAGPEAQTGAEAAATRSLQAGAGHSDGAQRHALELNALDIIEALGGAQNIEDVDACITRLRVSVLDPAKVDKDAFTQRLGATAVFSVQGGVQAVYGGDAIIYKGIINEHLGLDD